MSRNSKRENEDFLRKEKKREPKSESQRIIIFNGKMLQPTKCSKLSILYRQYHGMS